ncbi:hypothetical protein [Caudoviricetes sp.]|nr:hypothetical protein [Caudoviricetes sp.]UOF82770.1 hypothetical protein [Caudoviricetes sp.]
MREQSAMLTMLVKDDRLKELDIDIAKLIATKRRIISDAEKAPQLLETARADVARLERQLLSQTADNRQSRPSGASESMRQKSGETKREHYARLKVMMASLEKELGL